MSKISILTVLVVLVFTPVVEAVTYKWVDDEGRTHFSDEPPPQRQFEMVPQPHFSPPDRDALRRLKELSQSQEKARKARQDKETKRKKQAAEEAAEKAARAEDCRRVQEQLTELKGRYSRRRVLTTDDDGTQRRLTIAERHTLLKVLKEQVKDLCGK